MSRAEHGFWKGENDRLLSRLRLGDEDRADRYQVVGLVVVAVLAVLLGWLK